MSCTPSPLSHRPPLVLAVILLLSVHSAALSAADMALCSECLNLLLDEMPVGAAPTPAALTGARAGSGKAAAQTDKKTPSRRESGPRSSATDKKLPVGPRAVASVDGAAGGSVGVAVGVVDDSLSAGGQCPLERDAAELAELLRVFLSRVMSSSAVSTVAGYAATAIRLCRNAGSVHL